MKNKWGSHLLETLNKTESQTGPSQQIDHYRLAREIVNLQIHKISVQQETTIRIIFNM